MGEFVIVHELIHLIAPNHGKVFKSFLLAYLPDWETRESRLQEYATTAAGVGGRKAKRAAQRRP